MSVRRLADESVQPASFAFTRENESWARAKMAEYPAGRQQSAVIPLLMRAQDQDGWISRATIEHIATMLGMAYIRVLEVATFYTQFQLAPVGSRAHIQVCGTTPCMLRGAEDLRSVCQRKIHHDPHTLSEDGTLSWEEVECLGACVNAPMVAIFHDTYEDLTPQRLEEIIDEFQAGRGDQVPAGPQIKRSYGAPEAGRTTLLIEPTAKREKFVPPPAPEAPAAAAPAAAPVAAAPAPAKKEDPAPTTPGRKREVSEEAAPALKAPARAKKVSVEKAEAERKAADASAKADGKPARAMRPTATGAESKAGKLDGGASVPLFAAPEGAAKDDLKMISGVGPVLEGKLNAIGIITFAQVAAMKKADIARLEAHLAFPGRVERDDWIKQAKALAKGGEVEYIRVFGKKPR
ncbi:NADH-ubiquinone oxidoreductase chain E [Devosia sp. DBB001]|nr:NADH-ubiquinone oxidoreductase chain E [Devosia sp. DBB001]